MIYEYKHTDGEACALGDPFDVKAYGLIECPSCGGDIRRVWGISGFSIG